MMKGLEYLRDHRGVGLAPLIGLATELALWSLSGTSLLLAQASDSDEYVTGMTVIGKPNAGPCCPLIVWGVDPDTPAAKAGIKPGDRLLAIDGHRDLDVVDARPLLRTIEPKTSTMELEGDKGLYKVNVGRIKGSELDRKEGWKRGPNGSLFPLDATDAEIRRVSSMGREPPRDKKVFNIGHYPADLKLYYPGFELFVWDEPQPIMIGGIEDGPGKRAGVHYGDAIVSVNGVDPRGKSMAELEKLFSSETPADMTLIVDRDGIRKTFNFPLQKASEVAALNSRKRFEGRMIPSVIPEAYLHCYSTKKQH
jgi:PDZ domain